MHVAVSDAFLSAGPWFVVGMVYSVLPAQLYKFNAEIENGNVSDRVLKRT